MDGPVARFGARSKRMFKKQVPANELTSRDAGQVGDQRGVRLRMNSGVDSVLTFERMRPMALPVEQINGPANLHFSF